MPTRACRILICDLLRADSATDKTVWAFNGRSNSVSVMDAASNAVIATVPLPGKPEFPQVDGHCSPRREWQRCAVEFE
jgi:YVTN family beta-propeller protein